MPQQPTLVAVTAKAPTSPPTYVPLKLDATGALVVVTETPEPEAITPLHVSSGNVADAAAVATLPAAAGKTTTISGFTLSASGATAGLPVVATVTDGTWTLDYIFVFPAGVLVSATPLSVVFNPPLPASAPDTTIVVTLPAGGAGNTNAAASATGFQQ